MFKMLSMKAKAGQLFEKAKAAYKAFSGPPPSEANNSRFMPNHHQWTTSRSTHTFRVYVVEPTGYSPEDHTDIFEAALTSLVTPERSLVGPYTHSILEGGVEDFDLITFPEAFLPKDSLTGVLAQLSNISSFGCVHVGLRPLATNEQHLFKTDELQQLVNDLQRIPQIETSDLAQFSRWLRLQRVGDLFNVGCLFAVDSRQRVRICLHPKIVRSKYESSALQEHHMTEANLLTVVTLRPQEESIQPVTLQPLICSDALLQGTDRPGHKPLEAINSNAGCFGETPLGHIDIVSVATCTPQPEPRSEQGNRYRQWHPKFRESFLRCASDDSLNRHKSSLFVLSNFGKLPHGQNQGGLSGAFIPVPLRSKQHPDFVTVSSWGRLKSSPGDDNRWSLPNERFSMEDEWSSLGYIVSFDSLGTENPEHACMLGFTVDRLPHETTHFNPARGLTNFQLRKAVHDTATQRLSFKKEGQQ